MRIFGAHGLQLVAGLVGEQEIQPLHQGVQVLRAVPAVVLQRGGLPKRHGVSWGGS